MLTMQTRSPLDKIFLDEEITMNRFQRCSGLGGENLSFQLVLNCDGWGRANVRLEVKSPLQEIELFRVGNVPCELAAYPNAKDDTDYITKKPGLFPDPLFPLVDSQVEISSFSNTVVWVEVKLPKGCPQGEYPIEITASRGEDKAACTVTVEAVGADLPAQSLLYTQWLHGDCIAREYGIEVYSERYWQLLERYIQAACEEGMNMVLMPVLTPALDTEPGGERLCTQLVEIKKAAGSYSFDFSRVERFVKIAGGCGITHFEISHLFTQWGAKSAPNIYAETDGGRRRIFGWETPADSPEYKGFLDQLLPALVEFIRGHGLENQVIFHLSDEPGEEHLDSYRRAKELAAPHLKGFPIYDALSDYRFYESGLVEHPVPATNHIEAFLENKVPKLWAYYCCAQGIDVGNRFLAMPSYRNRILGWQLYKFGISGFLHWGYNFWNNQNSRGRIDPYTTTDAERAFPGGDAFTVYPGPDGPIKSLRMKVFSHGLQDLRALSLLETLGGRQAAESCMKEFEELTFSHYPRCSKTLLDARESVNRKIREIIISNKKG